MDLQLIGELFDRCIAAAAILGQDADFAKQLEAARRRLPPLQIGKQGQLQEWIGDWDMTAPEQGHRHLSHLYAMMPGQSITPRETPRFAAAVRKSLEMRGDGGMGWSKAWKVGRQGAREVKVKRGSPSPPPGADRPQTVGLR